MYIAIGNMITSSSQMNAAAASGGGGGDFENVYSMAFDGVDDYVDVFDSVTVPTAFQSIGNSNSYSISAWIKTTQNAVGKSFWFSGATIIELRNEYPAGSHVPFNFGISFNPSGGYSFLTFGRSNNYLNSGYEVVFSTADVNDGNWHHVAITIDVNDYIFYVDGSTAGSGTFSTATGDCSVSTITSNMQIGSRSRDGGQKDRNLFDGQVDELSIFNYKLTSGNITSIYNSGVPNNLNDLTTPPIAWYRMGENGVYKSPQWLLPENSNKDKVSNYSFEFDGVDDYVDTGAIDLGETNTISFWFKNNSANTGNAIIGDANDNVVYFQSSNLYYYPTGSITGRKLFSSTNISSAMSDTTNWHNIIFIRKAPTNGTNGYNDLACYLDGNLEGTFADVYTANINLIPVYIGKSGAGFPLYDGNIDEVSYYNNDQSSNVSSIYNSGVPTTITGAVAHYKMGEEATFSTNWTVPDSVGSNDGTSANMTIDDRVGDAPNSSNNSLSYNMVEVDRESDTP
tara:strand:- start:185 stop:1717 length:1533 start_codon:yes stop_codon:yes gene_type:complete